MSGAPVRQPYELQVTSPEHALLLAATRTTSAETGQPIEQVLRSSPDWTRVIELALRHRMTPALLAVLEGADQSLVPTELLEALRLHCDQLRAQSSAITEELFELLDALARDSVFAVPFKGPLLGEFLFGDAGMRYPGDVDILVRREDVSRVCKLLETRGYVDAGRRPGVPPLTPTQQMMYRRFQCEHTYVRASDGIVVEPHWGLSQHPLAMDLDYSGMLDRARSTELGGRPVLTLAPEDLLLALCIHGSKHHWERLSWIRDVAALVRRCPELDFDACLERASVCGCFRIVLVGLAIACQCDAGVRLPSGLRRSIDEDPRVLDLQRQALEWLFDPGKQVPRNNRVDRFRLMIRERRSDRVRYVSRTLLCPGRTHLEIVRLPASLAWLYFPLKWGHDFAALPLWRFVKPSVSNLAQ